jgi:hypothetical protein
MATWRAKERWALTKSIVEKCVSAARDETTSTQVKVNFGLAHTCQLSIHCHNAFSLWCCRDFPLFPERHPAHNASERPALSIYTQKHTTPWRKANLFPTCDTRTRCRAFCFEMTTPTFVSIFPHSPHPCSP